MSNKTPDFRLVIQKNNVDESKLSKPIKGYIKDYQNIAAGIADLEALAEQNEGKLDEHDQRELDEFRESLAATDKDLVKRINTWIANEQRNKEQGEKLRQGKLKKQQEENVKKGLNPDGTAKTEVPPTPAPAPAQPGTPPVPVKKEGKGEPGEYTPVEEVPAEEKKDTSILGWLIGGAVVVIGVLIGVRLKNKG